jgi:hypothetical protein
VVRRPLLMFIRSGYQNVFNGDEKRISNKVLSEIKIIAR